jgi:hypothetical protein
LDNSFTSSPSSTELVTTLVCRRELHRVAWCTWVQGACTAAGTAHRQKQRGESAATEAARSRTCDHS